MINLKSYFIWVAVLLLAASCASGGKTTAEVADIVPGETWLDTDSNRINAHGGGILSRDGKYYWYGEHRPDSGATTQVGVTCYSSDNLRDWKYEGFALAVSDSAGHDIERGCIIERPKVIFNDKTGKYVMWFHLELKGQGYAAARTAVAVSDTPAGPFKFLRSGRVNPGIAPLNLDTAAVPAVNPDEEWWTPEWHKKIEAGMFAGRDRDGGQMARDMTLFVDDNGKAYHIYSSEDNLTLQIAELTDDYLDHNGRYIRIFPGGHNEAPAIMKRNGKYWMIASGCTGWDPNEARMMSADSIFGQWTQHPNPCIGPNAEKTFGGQSTYILPVEGTDMYIAMFDRWNRHCLGDSRYVWLPIEFAEDGTPRIQWRDKWNPLAEVTKK